MGGKVRWVLFIIFFHLLFPFNLGTNSHILHRSIIHNLIPLLRMTRYDKKNPNAQVGIKITMSRYASSFNFISFTLFFLYPKFQGLSLARFSLHLTKPQGNCNPALIHIRKWFLSLQVFVDSKFFINEKLFLFVS